MSARSDDLDPTQHHVRETQAGRVQGFCREGICGFLGVPYAAPPVGANRFREPQPVAPWEGTRDATRPGPSAPQKLRPFPEIDIVPLVGDGDERGDDYLTLNIWAPEGASGRPVMVFVHGGGFLVGSKDAPIHDGTAFARSGVVCVAINYRLGIDGFLPIPDVPTNLGLRDMIAALHWVRANIAEFGGDADQRYRVRRIRRGDGDRRPGHLAAADGLFRRAIVQSGHGAMVREIPIAQRLVKKLARLLRIAPTADGFRDGGSRSGMEGDREGRQAVSGIDLRDAAGS